MAADRSPTGKVLQAIWIRWARRYQARFGTRPSKRMVSELYFEGDASLLAKWTTAADRPSWRVPLARLPELVTAFELDAADVDELLTARIEELQSDPEVMPLLTWLTGFLERTALDAEEREVLEAWRALRATHPLGLYRDGRQVLELQRGLAGVLASHQSRHEEDHAAGLAVAADETAEQRQEQQDRAKALTRRLADSETMRKREAVRARAEAQTLLKRLRSGSSPKPKPR
jgi:hypothetical protein